MEIIIFVTLGYLIPKILKRLKIKITPYQGITISLSIFVGVALFLSYILLNKLPASKYINGLSIPLIPLITALLIFAIIVILVIKKQMPVIDMQAIDAPITSWFFYFLPAFSIAISKYAFLLSIYSPKIFNSEVQVPGTGVYIYILGTVISALTIWFFSRFKNSKAPELFFWIALLTIIYGCYQTTLFSFLLIYGLLGKFSISYPFWASLMTIGYLPLAISLCAMAFRNDNKGKISI